MLGERLTFSRDVAPIIFSHCAPCHRPGQSAPFNLVDYPDVKKRAKQTLKSCASLHASVAARSREIPSPMSDV